MKKSCERGHAATGVRLLLLLLAFMLSSVALAADGIVLNRQKAFPKNIPAGDYSGITWLGGDRYAVVSDKSADDGFYIFSIDIDPTDGKIRDVVSLGFVECAKGNTDLEGIAWLPDRNLMLLCGEKDNTIRAFSAEGKPVDISVGKASCHASLPANKGLESLTYCSTTKRLWTCNEGAEVVMVEYDENFNVAGEYQYDIDSPQKDGRKASAYAHGVSELCALDDGTLLVMEREFYVPKAKIGASVNCKLFRFVPYTGDKTLLAQWKSRLNLTRRDLANYEGMCLGPVLSDGSLTLIMVADSQSRYKGVLKDWFRTVVIK